jgi:hypothetical protein
MASPSDTSGKDGKGWRKVEESGKDLEKMGKR